MLADCIRESAHDLLRDPQTSVQPQASTRASTGCAFSAPRVKGAVNTSCVLLGKGLGGGGGGPCPAARSPTDKQSFLPPQGGYKSKWGQQKLVCP